MSLSFEGIAEGFLEDCATLIETFKSLNTLRYDSFAVAWRSMNFSTIFCGRESFKEMIEFTEDIFRIAQKLWLHRTDFVTRIAGLYLMYGLYYKQPGRAFMKYRMTHSDWTNAKLFHQEVKQRNCFDASFIFAKLIVDGAFYFVATEKDFSEETRVKKQFDTEGQEDSEFSCTNFLESLQEGYMLENLSKMENLYREKMSILTSGILNPEDLCSVKTNLTEDLLSLYKKITTKKPKTDGSTEIKDEVEEEEEEDIGQRRRNLKQACLKARPVPKKFEVTSTEGNCSLLAEIPSSSKRKRKKSDKLKKKDAFKLTEEQELVDISIKQEVSDDVVVKTLDNSDNESLLVPEEIILPRKKLLKKRGRKKKKKVPKASKDLSRTRKKKLTSKLVGDLPEII